MSSRSDPDSIKRGTDAFIGKLRSNFMGTEFTLYDDGTNPKELTQGMKAGTPYQRPRRELGIVQYASNILGARGPRRMSVFLPRVVRGIASEFTPLRKDETIAARVKNDDTTEMTVRFVNKESSLSLSLSLSLLSLSLDRNSHLLLSSSLPPSLFL